MSNYLEWSMDILRLVESQLLNGLRLSNEDRILSDHTLTNLEYLILSSIEHLHFVKGLLV